MKTSEKLGEFAAAMSKFQSKLQTVKKDTKAYNYKYATLASICEMFRPLLEEHGFFIFQDVASVAEGVVVTTRIIHTSDQWIETEPLLIPMGKRDAHSTGSAATYGRRYSLCAALGIVTDDEDDDGAAAQKNAPMQRSTYTPREVISQHLSVDVPGWYKKMGYHYDLNQVKQYVVESTEKLRKTEEEIVTILSKKTPAEFKESFNRWQESKTE